MKGAQGRQGSMEGAERELRRDSAMERGCREAGGGRDVERATLISSGPRLPQARALRDSTWRVTSLFLSVMLDLGSLTFIHQQM